MLSTLHAELGIAGLTFAVVILMPAMLMWIPVLAEVVTSEAHPIAKVGLVLLLGLFPPLSFLVLCRQIIVKRRRARSSSHETKAPQKTPARGRVVHKAQDFKAVTE